MIHNNKEKKMVTLVGTQDNFAKALKELVELDYAAVDAYQAAIDRLDSPEHQDKLKEFKQDHEDHIKEVSKLLKKHNEDVPTQCPMGKELLATGKVVMANLIGENTILQAMKSNEEDTNTAYERMNAHKDKWPEAEEILKKGLQDEKRHKAWLEAILAD
jgi:ferritin-like metal-binding protein YciE